MRHGPAMTPWQRWKVRPMQGTQPRWARTLIWIGLGLGIVCLLLAAILSMSFYTYGMSFYLILLNTSNLVRPTRPRLANMCMVLGFVAAIAAFVSLFITGDI